MTEMTVEAVVRILGITPRTLRYYEEVGLITPNARTSGGHRLYDESNMERLKQILRLKDTLGFSLQEIRYILDSEASLQDLRTTYYQSSKNHDEQRSVIDSYIEVLGDLITKIDVKLESMSAMRDMYQERLNRSLQVRGEIPND